MPNIKPPCLAGSEAETLHALLQYQRDSLVRKVADLDDPSALNDELDPIDYNAISGVGIARLTESELEPLTLRPSEARFTLRPSEARS